MSVRGPFPLLLLWLLPSLALAAPNPLHPTFVARNEEGGSLLEQGGVFSEAATCSQCHDVAYIEQHNSHPGLECSVCHRDQPWDIGEKQLDEQGRLVREEIDLSAPTTSRCGRCHGLVHTDPWPLALPEDYDWTPTALIEDHHSLTKASGVVYSSQQMAASHLNLVGKDGLDRPFDIHAARLLTCTDCHRSANHPARSRPGAGLPHLKRDPRQVSLGSYLVRPDHRLGAAPCTSGHEPLAGHPELPYPKRHFERVACSTCHAPESFGPTVAVIDATLVMETGSALVTYHNQPLDPGVSPNVRLTSPFSPALLPVPSAHGGDPRWRPFNLVTLLGWQDAASGQAVPLTTLAAALLERGRYKPALLAQLDTDHDGRLAAPEQHLDTEAKVALVADLLRQQGVTQPRLTGSVEAHGLHHGTQERAGATMACGRCHGEQGRLALPIPLVGALPPGLRLELPSTGPLAGGRLLPGPARELVYEPPATATVYIFGHSREGWSDRTGFGLFLLAFAGIFVHGLVRFVTRRRRPATHGPNRQVYLYTRYQRLWHWLMAASIVLLLLTGLEVHFVDCFPLLGFAHAVRLHNALALVLIVNAVLSLFYHLVTTDIRQFIPRGPTLFRDVLSQARFYLHGIFVGAPHPLPRTPQRHLNPLQQVTYLMLLNVLIPFQVVTGILIWLTGRQPGLAVDLPGLYLIAPLHNLGSWALLAFVVAHLYLITTGHTLGSNLRAMITGYDILDEGPAPGEGGGDV